MLQIKKLRKLNKATQQQVSAYLGVSRPTYTRYENNEREPSLSTVIKLADYFGVTIDCLFGKESNKNCGTLSTVESNILQGISEFSSADKQNVLRYIDFIKKRNAI